MSRNTAGDEQGETPHGGEVTKGWSTQPSQQASTVGGSRDAPSGTAEVDAALARLAELEALGPTDHVEVFEDIHERLTRVLSGLDGG